MFSAVFGSALEDDLPVPAGEAPLNGSENMEYNYGYVNVLDCASSTLDWCPSEEFYILVYDSYILPGVKVLPESAAPFLEGSLNGLVRSMYRR